MEGGGGRSSPQDTRSPALWASSGCHQPVESRGVGAATCLETPCDSLPGTVRLFLAGRWLRPHSPEHVGEC